MADSPGSVQVVEQTIGPSLRSDLAARVADLVKQAQDLPDDIPGVLQGREELDEISKEIAKPDAKPSALQRLAYKALGAFALAAASSGGQSIIQGLGHIVKLLESKPPS